MIFSQDMSFKSQILVKFDDCIATLSNHHQLYLKGSHFDLRKYKNSCFSADHLVHCSLPVLCSAGSASPGSYPAWSIRWAAVLRDPEVGGAAGSWALDRRSHSDILCLQHWNRSSPSTRLLQQVPPQLLQVSIKTKGQRSFTIQVVKLCVCQ